MRPSSSRKRALISRIIRACKDSLQSAFVFASTNLIHITLAEYTQNPTKCFYSGCLGSYIDEERSEMRYVMRIA